MMDEAVVGRQMLDELYVRFNCRGYVHPDPLEFLYSYDCIRDREVVALVAASLAYGRVAQILKSVSSVLERMPGPAGFLERSSSSSLHCTFADFKHRFTTGEELAFLLDGMKRVIARHGSLQDCFTAGLSPGDETVLPGLTMFVRELNEASRRPRTSLLPLPEGGSACKRLNLFLRWMVRRDSVDPGGWDNVKPAMLIIPLDTHMHRSGLRLGFTKRKQADMRTALEITSAFRPVAPEDPVKYDFALTRLGIRPDVDLESELAKLERTL